ncbi:glycerol-3-phosphate acyltransferase, chloroplastic-like [Impatiens glandulifera]|uniref:glycerol-3-phosphate acyltransferase, chloroplastic-like n=1 Tax=Impatiens glandulifera TaxID=253017 RepID=UPI001FB06D54|nr:glycerol-3-phosphate acyltransferase, chloroplastic-like [Impatiens glandulifera]
MLILSAPSHSCTFATARVSSANSKLRQISCSLSVQSIGRRRCGYSFVLYCYTKAREMKENEAAEVSVVASEEIELGHSRAFLDIRTEEDLLSGIRREKEKGKLPPNIAEGMEELYWNYRNAVFQSGIPKADEHVLSNMSIVLDRVYRDVEDPFVFSPYHKAIRQPFDHYMFGQNYIRLLVDFRNSYTGNIPVFGEIEDNLRKGHNVILMSNHQTEADPAIIALLLEATNPYIAENLIYVAGDRVITDPLSKPFSMGRNLLCVYSKKHMNDVPELADMKKKANTKSLKEMAVLLRGGSRIIWIAPSGGRDRPDPITNEWFPAPFDVSSVDNMRRLTEHAGVPGHIYPLSLLCHDIMPPPPQVEKEIGEKRIISFSGTGLSVAPEISIHSIAASSANPEEVKEAYCKALYDSVVDQYSVLNRAIHGKKGLEASVPSVCLSQPWNQAAS